MEDEIHVIGVVLEHKNGEIFLASVYDGQDEAEERFLNLVGELVRRPSEGRYTFYDEITDNWVGIRIADIDVVTMLVDDEYLQLMLGGADDE